MTLIQFFDELRNYIIGHKYQQFLLAAYLFKRLIPEIEIVEGFFNLKVYCVRHYWVTLSIDTVTYIIDPNWWNLFFNSRL